MTIEAIPSQAWHWASFWFILLVRHRVGKQQLQQHQTMKEPTSITTKMTIILVDPPKLNAIILSLSVSEAEVRILSLTWGVGCPLHILMSVVLLLH